MRYYGGKGIHGKRISNIITEYLIKNGEDPSSMIYLEPFCGALGVMRHMRVKFKKCYANDICKDLIQLWKSIQKGTFKNPKITEKKWKELKYGNSKKPSDIRAFAGFGCSFGGVWFNGYIKDNGNNDMQYSSLIRLDLDGIIFSSVDYKKFLKSKIEKANDRILVYLDPPYKNTCNVPWKEGFDSKEFWEIVRMLSKIPQIVVIISELSAPKDFKAIHTFQRRSGMHNATSKKQLLEKLYIIK
jgi:DNA adenine methylase